MSDVDLSGPEIQRILRKLGGEASLRIWDHAGIRYYCVLAQTQADDRITRAIGDDDKPAEREDWQRANIIVAMGTDLYKTMWEAEHTQPLVPMQLTLWFDRLHSQYHVGPACERLGKSGRPVWAGAVTSDPESPILRC